MTLSIKTLNYLKSGEGQSGLAVGGTIEQPGFPIIGDGLFILVLVVLWLQDRMWLQISQPVQKAGRAEGKRWCGGHGRDSPATIFLQHFLLISKGFHFLGAPISLPCTSLFTTRSHATPSCSGICYSSDVFLY